MANIRICKKCKKIGLDQYDFNIVYWKDFHYSDTCDSCKKKRRENVKKTVFKFLFPWIEFVDEFIYDEKVTPQYIGKKWPDPPPFSYSK